MQLKTKADPGKLLVINVGSTSVKLALFSGAQQTAATEAAFDHALAGAPAVAAVVAAARAFLHGAGVDPASLRAIAARGGLLRPLAGGTYRVNAAMLQDLAAATYGRHASNFSALAGHGGMSAHLGTDDMRQVEQRIQAGDARAALLTRAMALAIARQIGAMATVLSGRVDAIVLTGALVQWLRLRDLLHPRIAFLGPVLIYAENMEMAALAQGVQRVLTGAEHAQDYLIPKNAVGFVPGGAAGSPRTGPALFLRQHLFTKQAKRKIDETASATAP